jgi:AraC family transcriptional regulator
MPEGSPNRYEDFANRISDYVQAHLDQDFTHDDLAAMLGVSKYHLNRLFQATTGFQLGEFIQRRRLQQAYALLARGECSVISASMAAGYESHSAFSRAFLKAFNCKPSDIKPGSECIWKTPNTLKNISRRDTQLQPEWIDLPLQKYRGFYGAGFKDNSFIALADSLLNKLVKQLRNANMDKLPSAPIGVSLESPWLDDQTASRFFIGIAEQYLPDKIALDEYSWSQGTWARFSHKGSYSLMWQTISRIYAGWVIPEGIALNDDAIVQVYKNNPKTTPEAELLTELYFPVKSSS